MTDPLVGRLVDGRYEVTCRIARGGMATVYVAVDRRLDRQVALKVMHTHLGEGPGGAQFVARFRREARAAARLAHPAIVAVYDQGCDGEMNYLAMEYVTGTTLRHELHEGGPFTLARTLDTLETICEGLAAAHRAGLVHRDVKPENVLIDGDERVRLTDFGLARAVDDVTATSTGTVLGTVAYLAPELIAAGTGDARCDVYAVGIMAYEMITGRVPHSGTAPIQVAFLHVNTDVPPPSNLVPRLPVEIDELVCALTSRDPSDRPVNAAAALALIRSTRAALSPTELSLAPAACTVPVTQTTRGGVTTAHDVSPLAAGDPGATELIDFRPAATPSAQHPGASPSPATSTPATPVTPRRRLPWVIVLVAVLVAGLGGGLWWWNASGPGAYTSVPDGVVGAEQSAAESVLDTAGLDHSLDPQYHDTVPAGRVISTDPGAGERVRKDGSVRLVVSRGVLMLTVPADLVGAAKDEATTALTTVGFQVTDPVTEYSDTVPIGQVMAVKGPDGDLADGDSIPHSTPITLTVSGGPAPIVVTDVVGAAQDDAVATLKAQGLDVTVTPENSETVPAGQVIRQEPAAGADAHRLDAATVVVSLGPPMVDLPNLYGKNVKDAQELLTAAGFEVKVEYPQTLHPFNMVYSQSPEGGKGKQAPKGSTITLNVF